MKFTFPLADHLLPPGFGVGFYFWSIFILFLLFGSFRSADANLGRFSAYGPVPGFQSPNLSFASTPGWWGKRVDETALIYFGGRYYDPAERRFISYDPLGPAATPGGYAAFRGDPLYWTDPNGMWVDAKYNDAVAHFEALADPERRAQAVADQLYGNAKGLVNWTVETGRDVDRMMNHPFGGYFNEKALKFLSNRGNELVNSIGEWAGADPNSPSARINEFVTKSTLTVGSFFLGPGEAKVASEVEQPLSHLEGFLPGFEEVAPRVEQKAAQVEFEFASHVENLPQVEQYALRASKDGIYPVMVRGSDVPQFITYLKKGDVWKFGPTVNPATRYSSTYLKSIRGTRSAVFH